MIIAALFKIWLLAFALHQGENGSMLTISFDFCGARHKLAIPDDEMCSTTAIDIINQRSYPLPGPNSQLPVTCVVDLGAHVGEFTIMAAARWPAATIHAFEPNPQVLDLLRQNCRPYPNIAIHNQGADVKAHRGPFFLNSVSSVAAKPFLPEVSAAQWTEIEVDYVGPEAIAELQPDVLKIDIEGIEHRFVESMGAAIRRVRAIYVEFHEEDRRLDLERLLLPSHSLAFARILHPSQGELLYLRRT